MDDETLEERDAAERDDLGIKQSNCRACGRSQIIRKPVVDFAGNRIAFARAIHDELCVDLGQIALRTLEHRTLMMHICRFSAFANERRSGTIRLDATPLPAGAGFAAEEQHRMTKLEPVLLSADEDFAVDHESAADSGTDGDE